MASAVAIDSSGFNVSIAVLGDRLVLRGGRVGTTEGVKDQLEDFPWSGDQNKHGCFSVRRVQGPGGAPLRTSVVRQA